MPAVTLQLVLGAAELWESEADSVNGGGPTPPSDGRWVFPLPAWRGYAPTRSQEYRARDIDVQHHGVDIMYRRKVGGADQMWPRGLHGGKNNGTERWFVPDHTPCCAARDGTIWEVGRGSRGTYIVIDHGKPFATFYTHLSSTHLPILTRARGAITVKAGDPIGIVGGDPSEATQLMHLHMEIWYRGGSAYHVDPWPLLERAPLPRGTL